MLKGAIYQFKPECFSGLMVNSEISLQIPQGDILRGFYTGDTGRICSVPIYFIITHPQSASKMLLLI